jgi:hypothetical protein
MNTPRFCGLHARKELCNSGEIVSEFVARKVVLWAIFVGISVANLPLVQRVRVSAILYGRSGRRSCGINNVLKKGSR